MYARLKGQIKEICKNYTNLARLMNIHPVTLSNRLNNKGKAFTLDEIDKICEILRIEKGNVTKYFWGET
ncbi:MAG: DUF739 family protein [Chitinispirillales bacterium]|jgi:DNA-binding Xre family transcriptional regulator|nr:DUF739 family protein [Chitinispirillales bacterium]